MIDANELVEPFRAEAAIADLETLIDIAKAADIDRWGETIGDASLIERLALLKIEDPQRYVSTFSRVQRPGWVRRAQALDRLVETVSQSRLRVMPTTVRPDDCPMGWTTPDGWQVQADGIVRAGEGKVCRAPLYVIGVLLDVDTGRYYLRLSWKAARGMVEHVVPAATAADTRALISLADLGAPITSGNARNLVDFIDAAQASNHYEVERIVRRCGWVEGGFVLGTRWMGEGSVELFADEGQQQVAAGIAQAGTWEGWRDSLLDVDRLPFPWVALWASVASVLIEPLKIEGGVVVDFSGETSMGKTTILRLAASVWGRPTKAGLLQSWKLTPSRFEGLAGFLSALPVLLDDTKQARRTEDIAGFVYAHAFGQAKGRARPDGLRASTTWSSVLISTGEQVVTAYSQDAGARSRCLCLEGAPLDSRKTATSLSDAVTTHYGHLGPRIIERVQELGFRRLRERYSDLRSVWDATLDGAVAGRLAQSAALLQLAGQLIEEVGVDLPMCSPAKAIEEAIISGSNEADRPAAAIAHVYSHLAANETAMWDRHQLMSDNTPKVPAQGWLGRWSKESGWRFIYVRPSVARYLLRKEGYDSDGVVAAWIRRGWLEKDSAGKSTCVTRIAGAPQRCLVIRRESLTNLGLLS